MSDLQHFFYYDVKLLLCWISKGITSWIDDILLVCLGRKKKKNSSAII